MQNTQEKNRVDQKKARRSLWMAVLGLSLVLGAPVAFAQEEETEEKKDDIVEEIVEEIVITGSLIKRSNLTTPTPVTVLDLKAIKATGKLNVVNVLNQLPSMATGNTTQTSNYSFAAAGLSQVNLRNLGTTRTLILVDGRRQVGTTDSHNNMAFDMGSISPQMIERIEVITGGASATYGSDAVAGVINIITRKNFEGTEINVQGGISSLGDGETTSVSLLTGHNFAENRGNAIFHFNFFEDRGVWQRDRKFQKNRLRWISNPEDTGPDDGIYDNIPADDIHWMYFNMPGTTAWLPADNSGPSDSWNYMIFDPTTGNLREFENGSAGAIDGYMVNGDGDGGEPSEYNRAMAPFRSYNVGSRILYDLTDAIRFTVEGRYNLTQARDELDADFIYGESAVYADNPYIKDDLRAILDESGETAVYYYRSHRDIGPRTSSTERQAYSVSAGLEGDLGHGWEWEAYYRAGVSNRVATLGGTTLNDRYDQATDAVRDPVTGEIVCRDPSDECVPFNPMYGTNSKEAIEWLDGTHNARYSSQQQIFSALLTGTTADWFNLPAGPVGVALGAEVRQIKLNFVPSAMWRHTLAGGSQFSPVSGTVNAKEAFIEVLLPVVKDVFLLDAFNIEAAARVANYNHGGSNLTWKVGADWAPTQDIRFRTVYSQAIRAPGIAELFDPGNIGYSTVADPCAAIHINENDNRAANCADLGLDPDLVETGLNTAINSSGNLNLGEEKAKTLTVGAVITPRWVPSFALAVDFWDMVLTDAIASFGAQSILDNCVDGNSLNSSFCDLVTRREDGNIEMIADQLMNADSMKVRGIDFEAKYSLDLEDLFSLSQTSTLNFGFVLTRLIKWDYLVAPDGEYGETLRYAGWSAGGDPLWRGLLNVSFSFDRFTFNWQTRYVGEMETQINPDVSREVYSDWIIPDIFYHSIYSSYSLEDFPSKDQELEFYVGLNNIFDTAPPWHPDVSTGWFTFYDKLGRYFFGGATVRF